LTLARGDADAYIGNVAVTSYLLDQNVLTGIRMGGYADMGHLELSMAARKGAEPLVAILNKGIAALSPEYRRSIINRYTVTPVAVVLSSEEREWIRAHPVIRLGVDPEFAPFEFVDSDGAYRGIVSDYLDLLNERLGLRMEVVHTHSWADAVEQMRARNLDVLPCLGESAERREFMHFTEPYLSFHRVIITRLDTPFVGGIGDLAGLRVAVQHDSSHADFLAAHPRVEPVYFDTFHDTLSAVAFGEVDYAVGNAATATYWTRKLGLTNLKLAVPLGGTLETLHFGVRKDWPELAGILEKGLASISEEEALAIRRRWMDVDIDSGFDMRRVWAIAGGVAAVLLPLILLVGLHNQRLRREVDSRLEAEQALQESEAKYRTLVEGANSVILRMTPNGVVVFINAFGEEFFEVEPGELLGKSVIGTIVPETDEGLLGFTELMDKLLRDPGQYTVTESAYTTKNGTQKWITWTNRPLLDARGALSEVLSVGIDVTERRAAAMALRRYDFIVNTVKEMMSIINQDGCYEAVNDEWCAVMGMSREAVLGKPIDAVWPADTAGEAIMPRIERCLAGETVQYETVIALPASGERFCEVTMYPFAGEAQHTTHAIVVAQDITERKRNEAVLEQAREAAEAGHRAKSAFLANMSHEIRTPLNAVLGYTQLLQRSPNLTDDQIHALKAIQRSGDHLLSLISDILELSRIEAGRLELYPESFLIERLLSDLNMMFQMKADAKGLLLEFDIDPGLPPCVLADRSRINQVLINLVGNAMKFTDEGGIIVRARRETPAAGKDATDGAFTLAFEVEDTGCGIAPEDQDAIFASFEQAGAAGLRQGGAGLGLSICQSFAESMGGGIALTSTVGKGSTFHFTLRAAIGDESTVPSPAVQRGFRKIRAGQPEQRVLVVDDRDTNRDLLCRMLADLGFVTREAENGKEAIERFAEWSPRIVLIDLVMPVMGGQEAIRRIRALPGAQEGVTIIALTASTLGEEKQDVLAAGANAFLRKPFRAEELLEEIRAHAGIEFDYDDEAAAPESVLTQAQARAAVDGLPADLADRLRSVVARGAISEAAVLAEQLRGEHADLARLVLQHATNYRLNELQDILT